jgi:hypothetical protein
VSNRRKTRPRLTRLPAAEPQLRRMTVRNERGDDVSWLFGVRPELRGGPAMPGAADLAEPGPGRSVRLVDELGRTLLDSSERSETIPYMGPGPGTDPARRPGPGNPGS